MDGERTQFIKCLVSPPIASCLLSTCRSICSQLAARSSQLACGSRWTMWLSAFVYCSTIQDFSARQSCDCSLSRVPSPEPSLRAILRQIRLYCTISFPPSPPRAQCRVIIKFVKPCLRLDLKPEAATVCSYEMINIYESTDRTTDRPSDRARMPIYGKLNHGAVCACY